MHPRCPEQDYRAGGELRGRMRASMVGGKLGRNSHDLNGLPWRRSMILHAATVSFLAVFEISRTYSPLIS